MQTLRCDVGQAVPEAGTVLVHLGQREAREDGAALVRPQAALQLTPYVAKRLQELLSLLVQEHDRRRGGG